MNWGCKITVISGNQMFSGRKEKVMLKKYKNTLSLLLFIAPFTILFSIFFLYCMMNGLFLSFTDWNGISKDFGFVGLKNYITLFNDGRFYNSLVVTFKFTFLNVILSNIFGLSAALVLEKIVSGRTLLRIFFFLPYMLSLVVVGFTWRMMFTELIPDLSKLFNWEALNINFLGNNNYALYSIVIMNVWYSVGYFLIIYTAALQTIDKNIVEAADIDGSKGWNKFINITLPLIMPAVTICIFTGIAGSMRIFDAVFILTSGGPGYATETIAINIYSQAFGSANLYGYGMAKSVVLALIILIISYFQLKFFKSKEVES